MFFAIRLIVGLCRGLSFIGGAAVVLMMLHISLDVLLLNLLRISMDTTPDIVARYYMVAVAFLPLGWLTLRRQMIAVELLDGLLPDGLRHLWDAVIGLIGTIVYGLIAYATWLTALGELRSGSFVELVSLQMPVWQSHFLVPAGFGVATLACALMTLVLLLPQARAMLDAQTADDAA
jgi:TRAP-type C4-dicarboxylate transport system permease small subunit